MATHPSARRLLVTTPRLPARPAKGHKGTFGTVLVVGGCAAGTTRMIGAPALAALGALRCGVGLCRVAAPEPIVGHVLRLVPSATGIALACVASGSVDARRSGKALAEAVQGVDIVVLGPGLGGGPGAAGVVRTVLRASACPVVVDADGLNAISGDPSLARSAHGRLVLTPHPGEWKRLAGALGIAGNAVEPASRSGAAQALAKRLGAVVVLKGAGTVVADGERVWVNRTGNAALATGGTGDVLAGVVGGLLAQLLAAGAKDSMFVAACAGVWAHGRAADVWAREHKASGGMLAADLLSRLPGAIQRLRARE
ncbi:MAG: NAD(P)H-hydrate dehydratase [Phycisphaerales bacterium]